MATEDREAYFKLTFAPSVELVSTVRRYVTEFYETILDDPDAASRVGLATHELLENAVKYGHAYGQEASLRVFITGEPGARQACVQTSNYAGADDIDALRGILAKFRDGDPDAVYQEVMRAAIEKDASQSGLGIARVWVEGEMVVQATVEDGVVSIDARTHIDAQDEKETA